MMKCIFGMKINIEVFQKLILSFWMCVARHARQVFKIRSLPIIAISPKKREMKLIFCLQINTKVFYQLKISLWMSSAMYAQSTHNNRFAITLQYLEENVKGQVEFLPGNKHLRFLQIDTILGVCGQPCLNYPK